MSLSQTASLHSGLPGRVRSTGNDPIHPLLACSFSTFINLSCSLETFIIPDDEKRVESQQSRFVYSFENAQEFPVERDGFLEP